MRALNVQTLFSFCSQLKCWLSRLELTNVCQNSKQGRPDQTVLQKQSNLGLQCSSRPFLAGNKS